MNYLGRQPLATKEGAGSSTTVTPSIWVRWQIYWYHRSGGLKRLINVGQENSYLTHFSFESNLKGCGAATISFGYIDFPIDADDLVQIYFNGTLKYTGVVEVIPDPKGGDVQLIPIWQRFQERIFNGTETTKSVFTILKDVITGITIPNISWNDAYVDTGSAATYTATYAYQPMYKIIDDLVTGKLTNRYWGVTETGIFYVRAFEASVTAKLYYNENPAYSDIEVTTDSSGIDATRYQVYIKQAGAGSTRTGQVGYGSGHGPYPIESVYREKEGKLTVPDGLTSGDAISYAEALILSYQYLQSIQVKNVVLDLYQPAIGKLITVQDHDEYILNTINSCDNTTGWNNATLDTTNFVEGTGSVSFTCAKVGDLMELNLGQQAYVNNLMRVGFMIRSASSSGLFLSVKMYFGYSLIANSYGVGTYGSGAWGIGDGTGNSSIEYVLTNTINLASAAVWYYNDFPANQPITRIQFVCTSTPDQSTVINIDRIQFFQTYATVYTQNIEQINYDITPANESVTMALKTYDRPAYKQLKIFQDQINALTAITTN